MSSEKSYVSRYNKFFLFFLNVIIWLVSVALLVVCIYVLVQKNKKVTDALGFFLDPACTLALVGSVAFALTLVGCWGSLRDITCLLTIYHWVATLFLLLQLVCGILFVVLMYVPNAKKTLNLYPEEGLNEAIVRYRDDADLEDLINTIQKDLMCCGVSDNDEGYLDWDNNVYFHCNDSNPSPERCSVPYSCCDRSKEEEGDIVNLMCGSRAQTKHISELKGLVYTRGCLKAITGWINDNAPMVGGIALGIIIPQIYFIYLAREMESQIKQQRVRMRRAQPR